MRSINFFDAHYDWLTPTGLARIIRAHLGATLVPNNQCFS